MNEKFNIKMHRIKCPNSRRGAESAKRVEYREERLTLAKPH
jgi:hypothetical protein